MFYYSDNPELDYNKYTDYKDKEELLYNKKVEEMLENIFYDLKYSDTFYKYVYEIFNSIENCEYPDVIELLFYNELEDSYAKKYYFFNPIKNVGFDETDEELFYSIAKSKHLYKLLLTIAIDIVNRVKGDLKIVV